MPDPANPYAAPKNAGTVTTAARRHGADLTGLDLDKLRLLRGKSYHLNIIGGFMAFFTAIGVFCLIIFTLDGMNTDEGQELQIFACVIIALHGTAMLCAWLRPAWGRTPVSASSPSGPCKAPPPSSARTATTTAIWTANTNCVQRAHRCATYRPAPHDDAHISSVQSGLRQAGLRSPGPVQEAAS